MVKELFLDFLNQADNGRVFDGEFYYNIHIHTKYCDDDIPVLMIKNEELFYKYLNEYFELIPLNKRNMAWLFINMTTEDFNNPENYIRRVIEFTKNRLLTDKQIEQISLLFDSDIDVTVQEYNLETPYSYNLIITNGDDNYILPSISYGIDNDTCYIYAIFDRNKHEDNQFGKKIKRKLYCLNKGIEESTEYMEYKNGDSYYPENISDVSPSAILSLTIFLNDLYSNNITKVMVVPYLPVRYNAKREYIIRKAKSLSKKDNSDTYINILDKLSSEQLRIQSNLTEKLIRDFYRLNYHFSNIAISSLPYEMDEFLHIEIGEFNLGNNELLNEIISSKSCKL